MSIDRSNSIGVERGGRRVARSLSGPLLATLLLAVLPAGVGSAQQVRGGSGGDAARWQLWEAADRAQRLTRDREQMARMEQMKIALEGATDQQLVDLEAVGPFFFQLNRALGRVVDRRGAETRSGAPAMRAGSAGSNSCVAASYTPGGPFPTAPYPMGETCKAGWEDFLGIGSFCPPALPGELDDCGNIDPISGGILPTRPSDIAGGGLADITGLFDDVSDLLNGLCSGPKTERQLYQTRFDIMNVSLIAELVADVAGRLCEQQISVIDIGGNLSFLCIPVELAYHVTEAVDDVNEVCDGLIDNAEIEGAYERAGHLHDNLNTTEAALAALDTQLATHDDEVLTQLETDIANALGEIDASRATILAALASHDTDIKATLAANTAFFLQTTIERALSREAGPNHVYRVASLYLPAVQGGLLATVRQVVLDAIANVEASGERTNDAQELFLEGEQLAASMDWKGAWDAYSEAYRAAVTCARNDRACR